MAKKTGTWGEDPQEQTTGQVESSQVCHLDKPVDEIIVVRDSRVCLSFPPFSFSSMGHLLSNKNDRETRNHTNNEKRKRRTSEKCEGNGGRNVDKLPFGFLVFVGSVSGQTPTPSSHSPSLSSLPLFPTCVCILPSPSIREIGREEKKGNNGSQGHFDCFFVRV